MAGRPEDWTEAHWNDWFHTSDPLMVVKLSRSNGRLTPPRQSAIMWVLLGEMEVLHPAWDELLSVHIDAWKWSKNGRQLHRIPPHLPKEVGQIQKECGWHEATPFRMLLRALAGDFARFLDEVNDSHFKAHFCEVIRDAILPPQCPEPTPEMISMLLQGPCPIDAKSSGADGWNPGIWADWLESACSPDFLSSQFEWMTFRNHALDHARMDTHGDACWIRDLLETPENSKQKLL